MLFIAVLQTYFARPLKPEQSGYPVSSSTSYRIKRLLVARQKRCLRLFRQGNNAQRFPLVTKHFDAGIRGDIKPVVIVYRQNRPHRLDNVLFLFSKPSSLAKFLLLEMIRQRRCHRQAHARQGYWPQYSTFHFYSTECRLAAHIVSHSVQFTGREM